MRLPWDTTPKIWYEFKNAVYVKDFSKAEVLLRQVPELFKIRNSIGETVLHFLAVENDIEGVTWLKDRSFDLDTKDFLGRPVIFQVAQLGYKELFLWFIKNGANVHVQDEDGQDILNYLLDYGSSQVVALVVPYVIKDLYLDINVRRFWELIQASHFLNGLPQVAQLHLILEQLSLFDLVGFHQRYLCFVEAAHIGDLYGAGSLVNGRPLSDDGFEYFRNWLVAQGHIVYESVLLEADTLANLSKMPLLEAWDEEVVYVASNIFQNKTRKNIYEQPPQFQCKASRSEFEWSGYCLPEKLKARFPSLWKIYGRRYKSY